MQEEEDAWSGGGAAAAGRTVDGRRGGRPPLVAAAADMTAGEEGGREKGAGRRPKEDDVAEAVDDASAEDATPKEEGSESAEGVVLVVGCRQQQTPPCGYSQENFHIADGNLYSILTPFQSRAAAAAFPPARHPTPAPEEGNLVQDANKGQQSTNTSSTRGRGRRRAKWKLKFHHQALPPEYLDHYEAAMAQEAKAAAAAAASTSGPASALTHTPPPQPLLRIDKETPGPSKGPPSSRASALKGPGKKVPNFMMHEPKEVQQAAKVKQFKLEPTEGPPSEECDPPSLRPGVASSTSAEKSTADYQLPEEEKRTSVIMASGRRASEDRVGSDPIRDLPYMGEMTLDSKPRRGRKPKKADICHLIYKNYGTVLSPSGSRCGTEGARVGSPSPSSPSSSASSLSPSSPTSGGGGGVNRNYAATESLLAKRLTQGAKRFPSDLGIEQDEPLNLCIRDLRRISVSGTFVKTEPTDAEEKTVNLAVPRGEDPGPSTTMSVVNAAFSGMAQPVAGNYIYWPNAGVFVHPMALQPHLLYCQKMGAAAMAATTAAAPSAPQTDKHQSIIVPESLPIVSLALPAKSGQDFSPDHASSSPATPFGRAVALRPVELGRVLPTPSTALPEEVQASPAPAGRKRPVHASSLATKRKRSAIFIPPTAENPTEVSICKFKFTGGAKPSLEEKKMLSVDAGGNFRYYSGTGDKSMRGYEFFPREQTLQHQYMGSNIGSLISGKPPTPSGLASSPSPSAHHFPGDATPSLPSHDHPPVVAGGEPLAMLPPFADRAGKCSPLAFHRQGGGNTFPQEGSSTALGAGESQQPLAPEGCKGPQGPPVSSGTRRKRRTRKSLVREKLEQTFREKGFLIQTQQLESAEGATYCKFRQLRKFTRYLFRSWKDYLPGNIKEISSSVAGGSVGSGQEGSETPSDPAVPGTAHQGSDPSRK